MVCGLAGVKGKTVHSKIKDIGSDITLPKQSSPHMSLSLPLYEIMNIYGGFSVQVCGLKYWIHPFFFLNSF